MTYNWIGSLESLAGGLIMFVSVIAVNYEIPYIFKSLFVLLSFVGGMMFVNTFTKE